MWEYVKSSKKGASICCDKCNTWVHRKCSNLNNSKFKKLQCNDDKWYCSKCKIILNETEIENTDTENNSSHHAKIKPLKLKCNYCPNVGSEQAGWYFVHSNKNNKNYSFCTKTCFESHAGKRISDYEINNCSVCMKKIGDRVESIFCECCLFWVHRKCIKTSPRSTKTYVKIIMNGTVHHVRVKYFHFICWMMLNFFFVAVIITIT